MKAFRGCLAADIRRLLKNVAWCAGILGVSVSLLFSLEAKGILNENVVNTYGFSINMSGSLIAYVFCALPFASSYTEDLEHRYIRYSVIRGNLKAYVLSKSLVIYVSSVLTMLGGTFLFLFLCRLRAPWVAGEMFFEMHGAEIAGCYGAVLEKGHPVLYCMLSALNLGFIAGALSNFAALCSVYISNKALVLVSPVVLFRILASVGVGPEGFYNIYSLYATNAVFFQKDWMNFLTVFLVTAVPALIFTVLCGGGLKRRL